MAVTLTPADVDTITGVTVTQAHIDAANEMCDVETRYTFVEHNESRLVPEAMVEHAWAITAANVAAWFDRVADSPDLTSENQGDYSYTVDQVRRTRLENASPITPPVRRLLNIAAAAWSVA